MADEPIINEITISVTGTVDITGVIDITRVISIDPEPPEPTPPPEPAATLVVEITRDAGSYVFDEASGTDLGDYCHPGGHFTQRCVLVTHPDLSNFSVFFRSDRDAARDEVVFEFGSIFTGEPTNMGPYTARIWRGTEMLAEIEAPLGHYWHSRWRWQSAPRPIIYDPAVWMSEGLLPYYSEALFGSAIPLSNPRTYAGPMDLAGIEGYIPSTGERDEIGLFTEGQAEFLCTGSESSWASVQAWLEASGTLPWHFRDENTHAPLDWDVYPNATMYGGQDSGDPHITNPTSPIMLDVAHEGSFGFLPFVLTGDPYALESMQYAATYNVVSLSPGARANYNLGNGIRGMAWSLRALAQCVTVTPETIPSWLKPRAYFKARLDAEHQWFLDCYVNSDELPACNLSLVNDGAGAPASLPYPANSWFNIWQEDFLTATIGWMVTAGHENWRDVLTWKATDVMARTNGTSGWCRAVPTLYQFTLREAASDPIAPDWGAAWAANEAVAPDKCVHDDPDTIPASLDLTYPSYALGALAFAARAGVPQARASYDWLLGQLQANTSVSKYTRRKWAIAAE